MFFTCIWKNLMNNFINKNVKYIDSSKKVIKMAQRQRVRSKFKRLVKRSKYLPQGIATTLTVTIIAIIVLAPNAMALSVGLYGLSDDQKIGNSGSFTFLAKVTVSSGEVVPVHHLNVVLDSTIFQFNPNTGDTIGTASSAISSVVPVGITPGNLYNSAYGWAYGYFKAYSYGYSHNYYGVPGVNLYSGYGYGLNGPQIYTWNVTLLPENLDTGDHTVRVDAITVGLTMNDFSSSTVTFEVVGGVSKTATVPSSRTSITIDHTSTTKTKVVLRDLTFIDSDIPGTLTTTLLDSAPSTSQTVLAGTDKTPIKFVDITGFNFDDGSADITITYTNTEVSSVDENALTLYYWSSSAGTWVQLSGINRDTAGDTVKGTMDVDLLSYIALAAPAKSAAPAQGAGPGLPGVSASVTTNLELELVSLQVAPGSSVTVTITLSSTSIMSSGSITLTLPENLVYSDLRTVNFDGTNTLTGRTLVVEKASGSGSTTSRIFFTMSAPLDSTIKVGEIYTITIDEIIIQGMTVTYGTEQTVTITITQPTVQSIFSALDSRFIGISSPYTENRVPTVTDIMNLVDFRLVGEVQP